MVLKYASLLKIAHLLALVMAWTLRLRHWAGRMVEKMIEGSSFLNGFGTLRASNMSCSERRWSDRLAEVED
jgi:hypothetical protein